MQHAEILLLLNSCLLTLATLSFAVIGYFLKGLHGDFDKLIDRFDKLYTRVHNHVELSEILDKTVDKRLDEHHQRLENLERP